MRRIGLIGFLLCASLALSGCGGVILSASYSQLLDETTALSATLAERAEAGRLDANSMTRGLRWNADMWRNFQDARDGRQPGKP